MRTPPPKPTFTFSSGITVTLERVGPLFAMPIQRAHPPPSPPLAPGVGGALEPNEADPDYIRAVEAHQGELALLIQDAILDAAIGDDLEVDTAAVARLRRVMKRHGAELPEDDRLAYIKYCVVTNGEDLERFMAALAQYDGVREADVAAAAAMFSGDGAGAAA